MTQVPSFVGLATRLFLERLGRLVDLFFGAFERFLRAFLDRAYHLVLDAALFKRIAKQRGVAAKVDS